MENINGFKSCGDGHSIIYYREAGLYCPLCAQKRKNEIALELIRNVTNLIKENCPNGCHTLRAVQKITDEK